MNKARKPSAALFAFLGAVACNAILGNESSYNLVPKTSCLLSSDCPNEQICAFETCSKPCKLDKDCAPGDRCLVTKDENSTACVGPIQATCSGDTCPSGTSCSNGECRTVCDDATPCRKDQQCVDAACVGTDRNHDPEAASLGGTGGTSGAPGMMSSAGKVNTAGMVNAAGSTPEGGDAGSESGGSGAVSGGDAGGNMQSGGTSAGGTVGSGGDGTSGAGERGGSTGSGGIGGNAGFTAMGGFGGSAGFGAMSGSTGNAGSGAMSGSAGSAGSGAMSGSAGSAGSGGKAGSAGSAGSGGVGGLAGSSGSAGKAGSGGTGGGCSNGTYQCISNPTTSQKCVNGSWSNDQLCTGTTPACFAGKCSACADPATDCSNNVPRTCVSGVWQNGTACSGGTTCSAGACTCALTTCGSACIDTQTDKANCGTCGRSCQTGDCIAGKCQPVKIAEVQNKPWSIATDGTTLYWVNQGNQTLVGYTLASGEPISFQLNLRCLQATGPLAVFGGKIWWSTMGATCWVATPGTGSVTDIASLWGNSTMINGLAASSNGAYMVDPFDNWIKSSAQGTYTYKSTVQGVAADSAGVYWLEGTNLVKQHDTSQLNTGTPGVLSSGITTSEGITTYNSFVYFTSTDSIYRVPNLPGLAPTLLLGGQTNPSGIAVDASGIYWTNRTGGTVMRAPLTGMTATPIASSQNDPHGIALDANTVYWTNTAGGQVMKVAK